MTLPLATIKCDDCHIKFRLVIYRRSEACHSILTGRIQSLPDPYSVSDEILLSTSAIYSRNNIAYFIKKSPHTKYRIIHQCQSHFKENNKLHSLLEKPPFSCLEWLNYVFLFTNLSMFFYSHTSPLRSVIGTIINYLSILSFQSRGFANI